VVLGRHWAVNVRFPITEQTVNRALGSGRAGRHEVGVGPEGEAGVVVAEYSDRALMLSPASSNTEA
jgi:hypothetical protein